MFHLKDVDTQGDPLQNKMVYNNADYSNQEQYIENCNGYEDFQSEFNAQTQTSYGNTFGQLATSRSSLETSRQNSYEREERQYYYNGQYQEYSPTYNNGEMNDGDYEEGALFYNSRPMKYEYAQTDLQFITILNYPLKLN